MEVKCVDSEAKPMRKERVCGGEVQGVSTPTPVITFH